MSAVCAGWFHSTASHLAHVVWVAKKVLCFAINAALQGQSDGEISDGEIYSGAELTS